MLNSNLTESFLVKTYLSVAPIVLKFCTEHGSNTAVPCAKFQNDFTAEDNSRDLSLIWVLRVCFILQQYPDVEVKRLHYSVILPPTNIFNN